MKTKFEAIKNNKLVINSAILFFGSMMVNVLNYLYHLIMGRALGPADYGTLAALISIIGIVSVFGGALSLAITKFAASTKAEKNKGKAKYLFLRTSKIVFFIGLFLFLIFALFSGLITDFLKIDSVYLVLLVGVIFIVAYLPIVSKGITMGWQRFKALSLINFLEAFIKLVAAIALVYAGFRVFGAIAAFIISIGCGYIFSLYPIKDILYSKKGEIEGLRKNGIIFAIPSLLLSLSIILFYNADIILVKHFLSGEEAGFYSALSTIGRIIFFAAGPVSLVVFPTVAEKYSQNKKTEKYLFQGVFLVLVIAATALIFYFLIPNFVVLMLYGGEYLKISGLLGAAGLSATFLALNNLIGYYYLSLEKKWFLIVFWLANISQIILIMLFHQIIVQIIYIQLFVMIGLFLGLVVYHFRKFFLNYGKRENINYYPGI